MDRITDPSLDFKYCHGSVLLNSELYCYFNDDAFIKISNIDSSRTQKSLARITRSHGSSPALAGTEFKRGHLFITGGRYRGEDLDKVSVYSVH